MVLRKIMLPIFLPTNTGAAQCVASHLICVCEIQPDAMYGLFVFFSIQYYIVQLTVDEVRRSADARHSTDPTQVPNEGAEVVSNSADGHQSKHGGDFRHRRQQLPKHIHYSFSFTQFRHSTSRSQAEPDQFTSLQISSALVATTITYVKKTWEKYLEN